MKTGSVEVSGADKDVEIQIFAVSAESFIAEGISIYPNPTSGEIIIDRTEHSGKMRLRLGTVTGAIVFDKEYGPSIQNSIVLDGLEPGVYFLELRIEEKLYNSKLIMK